jgi:hypothetical protein
MSYPKGILIAIGGAEDKGAEERKHINLLPVPYPKRLAVLINNHLKNWDAPTLATSEFSIVKKQKVKKPWSD